MIAGGAGVLVLEELEHAKARGAKIYGEIVGYGATSDGYDMVAPSGEGAVRCMRMALQTVKAPIDYINPHGTSTPVGDLKEIEAIREVFGSGDKCPPISATKSLTGHSLGATGVQEAIYSLLMMNNGFICESAHIEEIDPAFADMNIVRKRIDDVKLDTVLSNSFGFGGTNATLVFSRYKVETTSRSLLDMRRQGRMIRGSWFRLASRAESCAHKGMFRVNGLMQGKRGLIMGVANDHSIAWGIAKTLAQHGAELAFTYQGEALGKRVTPLAQSLGSDLVVPCDVEDIASVDAAFDDARQEAGTASISSSTPSAFPTSRS